MAQPLLRPALKDAAPSQIGQRLYEFVARLYPLPRSITGAGLRATLDLVETLVPLSRFEIPSGEAALGWTVPPEWVLHDAWIKGPDGRLICRAEDHPLHVLNYSTPVRAHMTLADLRERLFSLPDRPHAIPYRTSYYTPQWGFCLAHAVLEQLEEGTYEVCIEAEHRMDGSLSYGEAVIPGASDEEVLISAHCCHPGLANDNCSGIAIAAHLGALLKGRDVRYTYRLVFAPGTIGALVWLARRKDKARAVKHGLVLAGLGDPGGPSYKRSRQGDAAIDHAAEHALKALAPSADIRSFWPYGYDERQYCSPGYNLPVGVLMGTPFGEYPEYHTSDDHMDFVRPEALARSFSVILDMIDILENDLYPISRSPFGEANLGRHGLYAGQGGNPRSYDANLPLLWVMNQADGGSSLLDIARRSGLPFPRIHEAARRLAQADLIALSDRRRAGPMGQGAAYAF